MRLVGPAPVGGVELGAGHGLAGGGTDEANPLLHPAIVEHARRRRQNDGGTLRAGVDRQPGLLVGSGLAGADVKRDIGGERLQPVAAHNLDQLGDSPGAGMLVEGLAPGDGERVGAHGLDPDLVGAGLHGLLDVGIEAIRSSSSAKSWFCSSMGSASSRFRNTWHRRQVLLEVASWTSLRPVASSKRSSDQPGMLPRQSAM